MNKFLLLLLYFVSLQNNNVHCFDVVNCDKSTPVFNISSLTFFESSSNFPHTLLPGLCNARFIGTDETINLWIALYNGAVDNIKFLDDINYLVTKNIDDYNSNFDVVTFSTYSNYLSVNVLTFADTKWSAFQAAVVPYSINDELSCPLNLQTIYFDKSQPTQVIPITNSYGQQGESDYKLCKWIFIIDLSQQLKVVVNQLNIADEVQLILYGDDDKIIKNFTINDSSKVFYFTGTSFRFVYEYQFANTTTTTIEFFMLVSAIVESENMYNSIGCKPPKTNDTTNNTIVYSNIDYNNGYPIFQRCEYPISIPTNHEATLAITEFLYEACCDVLSVNYDNNGDNKSLVISWYDHYPIQYIVTNKLQNGSLIFLGDGNTQAAGFSAELQLYECVCSDRIFVISCNSTAYFYPQKSTMTYCSNMDCEYMITRNPDCPDSYLHLVITNHLRSLVDFVILKDDNAIDQNMTASTGAIERYFSPNNQITVQFHSGSGLEPVVTENKFWSIYIDMIPTPTVSKVKLNDTYPKHILWLPDMNVNDAITVCTSTNTLEMFVTYDNKFTDDSGFIVYDSNDLNQVVGDLNLLPNASSSSVAKSIKSASGCFTIYSSSFSSYNNQNTILFKISNDNDKNCQQPDTVFQVTYDGEYDISNAATTNSGACEIIILAFTGRPQELPHIWINSMTAGSESNAAVYTILSTVNNKKLFDFNSSDAYQWQSVGIYSQALTIIIPTSSSLSIHLSSHDQIVEFVEVVSTGLQKGIMASPSYSGIKQTFATTKFWYMNGPMSFLTDIFIVDVYGSPKPTLETYPTSQPLLLKNTSLLAWNFYVNYAENDFENNGFLIEYHIQGNVPIPIETTTTSSMETTENEDVSTEITQTHVTPTLTNPTMSHATITTTTGNGNVNATQTPPLIPNLTSSKSSLATTTPITLLTTTQTNLITISYNSDRITKFELFVIILSLVLIY